MTIASGYNLQQVGYYTNDNLQITAVHIEYRVLVNGSYQFHYMWFLDSDAIYNEIISYNLSYTDMTAENFISRWTSHGSVYSQGILKTELNSLLNDFEYLYLDGFDYSYNIGYNDGLNESDIAENTILTIFSAPTYILSTIFDFELFGINIYALICFFLTLTVISFILKRVL